MLFVLLVPLYLHNRQVVSQVLAWSSTPDFRAPWLAGAVIRVWKLAASK